MVLTWNLHKFSPIWGHFDLVIVKAYSRDHCSATVAACRACTPHCFSDQGWLMQDAGAGGQGGGAGCLTKDDSCRTLALAAKAVGLAV